MDLLRLLDRARGSLAGLAVGDALGMPVNSMSRAEIQDARGPAGVTGLIAPIQTRIKDAQFLNAGCTTDDTRQAAGVVCSLIKRRKFCLLDQAKMLVQVWQNYPGDAGGKTTRRAAKRLCAELKEQDEQPSALSDDFESMAPLSSKRGRGTGNGPAMKVAPLALFRFAAEGCRFAQEPLLTDTFRLDLLTHGDPRAAFGASAVAAAITAVLDLQRDDPSGLRPEQLRQMIQTASLEAVLTQESRHRFFRNRDPPLSSRLELAFRDPDIPVVVLVDRVGAGCFTLESIPFALAMASRYPLDYTRAVLETVNAGGTRTLTKRSSARRSAWTTCPRPGYAGFQTPWRSLPSQTP